MCPATDNPASCKIHTVIGFLHAKNMSATEIHQELCAVYGRNVMSEGIIRQWCRMFKDGQTNIQDVVRSGQPFAVSDDQKYVKDCASQFQNFHVNFHTFQTLFSMRLSQLG
jgi:transposase